MEIKGNIAYTDLDEKDIPAWKFLLENLTFEKICNQIKSYQDILIYPTPFTKIEEKIDSLFNVEYQGKYFFPNFKHTITSKEGERLPLYFFRIRKIEKGINYDVDADNKIISETFDFEDIQKWNDVWEKPVELVTHYQRLSKPKNSVLYTSLMTSTALLETNINSKDRFFLIVYRSKRKIRYSDCCNFLYYNNLSETENMKRYIIFQFLRNEFTRVLPNSYNFENQYCAAAAISKKFFISKNIDGIQYPSTRGLGHRNFAFLGNIAQDCIEFKGLRCCIFNSSIKNQSQCSILADGFWNNELNKFEYFSPNSKKSKQIYNDDKLLNILMSK